MQCPSENGDAKKGDDFLSRLLKARTILISGQIDEELMDKVIAQLLVLDAESHEPIRVMVTTPGGMVDAGFAIHDMMQYVESEVISIGAGFVASMGIPILLASKKENRYALPNTRFMMHQPSGGAGGHASDIRITAREILKVRERLNNLIAAETGKPIAQITADSDRDFWLNAEEAVEYGLIAKVIHSAKDIA